jgi:ABC-type transporter Mla maintaining outer membrane lipid asymmetry permease subunit MlaE
MCCIGFYLHFYSFLLKKFLERWNLVMKREKANKFGHVINFVCSCYGFEWKNSNPIGVGVRFVLPPEQSFFLLKFGWWFRKRVCEV